MWAHLIAFPVNLIEFLLNGIKCNLALLYRSFFVFFFFWAASQVWADNLTGEKGDWGPFQRTFLVLFFGFLFLLLPLVISCWQMSWLLMAAVTSFLELARMESENNFYHCLFPFVSRLHFVLFVVLFFAVLSGAWKTRRLFAISSNCKLCHKFAPPFWRGVPPVSFLLSRQNAFK